MPELTSVLRPTDAQWDGWLQRIQHDFYFRADYHAFAEQMGEGLAHMVVYGTTEQFVAWPYLLCDIDGTYADANSVYGYTGPVGQALDDAGFRQEAWNAIRSVWNDQKLVSVFTRFHPLLQNWNFFNDLSGSVSTPGGQQFHLGRTVSIDLEPAREMRRRSYKKNLRQEIQNAERAGLVVEQDHAWHYYPRFMDMYRSTMQKNQASERYLFSDRYFQSLRSALGETGHLAVVHMHGEPAAILLFTVCGTIAQAHLTGVNPEYVALSPLKLLLDGVADMARSMGANIFHLGAGRGGYEDSLFEFKCRFSPLRHDFELGRWIIDEQAYNALMEKMPSDLPGNNNYFPAYRAT